MPQYVRARVEGGTYFFTVVTYGRQPLFESETARRILRESISAVRTERPFTIDTIVLLPDHLHAIWTLPEGDADYSTRWAMIKKWFSQSWLDSGGAALQVSSAKQKVRRVGVWQKRFWEHVVRKDEFESIAGYIHFNPVKHGLVRCPHEWPHSTFHQWVADGRLPVDWKCVCDESAYPPEFPEWLTQAE